MLSLSRQKGMLRNSKVCVIFNTYFLSVGNLSGVQSQTQTTAGVMTIICHLNGAFQH